MNLDFALTMARPPCRYYQSPNGCRNGQSCHFAHTEPPGSPDSAGSPSSSTTRRGGPRTTPFLNAASTGAPPGVCRYYWTSGQCKLELRCHFRHDRPDTAHSSRPSSFPRASNSMSIAAKEMVAPFLTENGLAKINSNATDGFFAENETSSLSPTEAHRQLQRFLKDNSSFKTSFDVYAFLVPLCSANPSNTQWVKFYPSVIAKLR